MTLFICLLLGATILAGGLCIVLSLMVVVI